MIHPFNKNKYFYDGNKKYYKKINNKTLKLVSEKEFYSKTKYSKKNINALNKSEYPWQLNNYILVKDPYSNKIYPADYQLANIIKYLLQKGFRTIQWNQPNSIFNNRKIGCIDVKKYIYKKNNKNKNKNKKNVIDVIIKLFGKNMVKIVNNDKNIDYKKICIIKRTSNYYSILFNNNMLKNMHKYLHIKIPKKSNSLPGGIILYKSYIKDCKLI